MCSVTTSEPHWLTKRQHTPTLPYICKFSELHNQLCPFSVWTAVVWLTFPYSLETINPWIQPTLPGTSLQQGPGHLENFYQYGDQGQRTSQFPVTYDAKSNAARGNGGGQTCPTKTSHTVNLCMKVSQEDKHSQQWTRSVNKTLPSGIHWVLGTVHLPVLIDACRVAWRVKKQHRTKPEYMHELPLGSFTDVHIEPFPPPPLPRCCSASVTIPQGSNAWHGVQRSSCYMGRVRLVWAELPGDTLYLGIKGQFASVFHSLSVLLKIVSSSGFITNEGWIVLSRIDAWMSRSRQTSVGRIKSIPFQFRISQSSWLY